MGGRHQNVNIQLPQHDVILNTTENAYKPVKMANITLDDTEKVLRDVRAILNKLTPQNFQKLVSDLVNLEINANDNRLRGTIDIIFEKSIDEPKFSQTYANLCKALNQVSLNYSFHKSFFYQNIIKDKSPSRFIWQINTISFNTFIKMPKRIRNKFL